MQNELRHTHGATKPTYNLVFVVLFVLTVLELIAASVGGIIGPIALIALSVGKAGLVVAYYMHLKYDPPLYTWVFVVPMIMGLAVILSLQGLAGY